MPTKPVTVRLTPEAHRDLRRLCQAAGISMSGLVEAITATMKAGKLPAHLIADARRIDAARRQRE